MLKMCICVYTYKIYVYVEYMNMCVKCRCEISVYVECMCVCRIYLYGECVCVWNLLGLPVLRLWGAGRLCSERGQCAVSPAPPLRSWAVVVTSLLASLLPSPSQPTVPSLPGATGILLESGPDQGSMAPTSE